MRRVSNQFAGDQRENMHDRGAYAKARRSVVGQVALKFHIILDKV